MATKAPTLPTSLSPHVLTLLSPDLVELLTKASLPPLHHILQSYAPLPLVTTRTSTFTQVQHQAFHLRFSDLDQITVACKEDEETRSSRFIDWAGSRIARRAPKWVEDVSQHPIPPHFPRTPWWDEVRKCIEGEWVPSRSEGWNHPVAIIYAVSTMAPNPLQAVTNLYSRPLDLPSWIDPSILRFILIINPSNSPLNQDECTALYNAVKKQYNLHVHMLNLSLQRPAKAIPIISMPPQLPPNLQIPPSTQAPITSISSSYQGSASVSGSNVPDTSELWMNEHDAQATGKFVREFLTQSLLPWMEKCVLEWNEAYANNKRLPSRLFSSTRRLFGASTPTSSTPTSSGYPSPVSPSTAIGAGGLSAALGNVAGPPPQHRRLAEFATFLGDFRLAIQIWEAIRKEGKGGAAILPLILTPSKTFVDFAAQSLTPVFAEEPSATALLKAATHAVRWEAGVPDLLNLGGERWLVWAASTAEEAVSALILGHAAHLSRLKGAKRRAALWYVMAGHRLEKVGIKALTAYFLREAHSIYTQPPEKLLSPAYAEAEEWPKDAKVPNMVDWPVVMTNIEHSLGRIQYSSGEAEGAVKSFLGLFKYSLMEDGADSDAVVLDDFKQALEHLETIHPKDALPSDLHLPISFCLASESQIRLNSQNERHQGQEEVWTRLEATWTASREKGKGRLEPSSAEVGHPFYVEIALENPIEAPVVLKNFTLKVTHSEQDTGVSELANCEVIEEVWLYPKERRNISISVTPLQPGPLYISSAKYSFISHLSIEESLSIHGMRLNSTPAQMRAIEYAPAKKLTVNVRQGGLNIDVFFLDEEEVWDEEEDIVMIQGEIRQSTLRLVNRGAALVEEAWIVVDDSISLWIDKEGLWLESEEPKASVDNVQRITFSNQIHGPKPVKVPIGDGGLQPGQSLDVPILLHTVEDFDTTLSVLFTYAKGQQFYYTRFAREVALLPALSLLPSISPTPLKDDLFGLRLEIENLTEEAEIHLDQVTLVSMDWMAHPGTKHFSSNLLPPRQISRASFTIDYNGSETTQDTTDQVIGRISDFLLGKPPSKEDFPQSTLQCCHFGQSSVSLLPRHLQHFFLSSRRQHHRHLLTSSFPTIPQDIIQHLLPLYTPHSLDIIIFWSVPNSHRRGFILSSDLQIGVGHGLLQRVIEEATESKAKSMYAETKREHEIWLQHFTDCEWNRETDPLVVFVKPAKSSVEHDFTKGACLVPVEFILRNYSPTNPLRYALHLPASKGVAHLRHAFAAAYSGQLSHRGVLQPLEQRVVKASLRVSSGGQFSLSGWRMEVDVGSRSSVVENGSWTTIHRYLQQSTEGDSVVQVRDVSLSR